MSGLDSLPVEPRNHLLAALPAADLARLWPRFERVELPERHVLHSADEPMTAVHFPESGWLSMVTILEDGDVAEIGLVGREGMVGLPLLLGSDRAPMEALVQARCTMLRLSAAALREELEQSAALRMVLLRYALAFITQVSQTGACNGRHRVEQRLARWILMAHDRSDGDDFPMTHEFLSMMLGVRRAGISVAAGRLQKAGLIRYRSGHMLVADRPGLEATACDCNEAVQREFRRLFGSSQR
jgi:CRP-like cAMP-binding protein